MGTPLKLTEEVTETFCRVIAEGGSFARAAKEAGVSHKTARDWTKRPGEAYRDFQRRFKEALEQRKYPLAPGDPRGRPSLLCKERADRAVRVVRLGGTIKAAARAAGVSQSAFHAWMSKDAPKYLAFQARIIDARSQAEEMCLGTLADAGKGAGAFDRADWAAHAWLLERSLGYTRGGGAAAPLPTPAPGNETPEEARVRILQDLLDNATQVGLSPERRLEIVRDLYEARKSLGGGDDLLTEDEIVASLKAIPPELLQRALEREE